jgi:hypothetical protein
MNLDAPASPAPDAQSGPANFGGFLRASPEGLLLIAAGCALLFGVGRRGGGARSAVKAVRAAAAKGDSWGRAQVGRAMGRSAERAAPSATPLPETPYVEAAANRADAAPAARNADLVAQATSSLQSALGHLSADQPLVLGAMALAAGAVVGACLPATAAEDRTFGEARERVVQAAMRAASDQLARLREGRNTVGDAIKQGTTGTQEAAREGSAQSL